MPRANAGPGRRQYKIRRFLRAALAGRFSVAFMASPFAIESRWCDDFTRAEVEVIIGNARITGHGVNPEAAMIDCATQARAHLERGGFTLTPPPARASRQTPKRT